MDLVAFHIDPLLTAGELGTLVSAALDAETGRDLTWLVDPSAAAVFTLAKGGFGEMIIIDAQGRIAYKGGFPPDDDMLLRQVTALL